MTSPYIRKARKYRKYREWAFDRAMQVGQLDAVIQSIKEERKKFVEKHGKRLGGRYYVAYKRGCDRFSFCRWSEFDRIYRGKEKSLKKANRVKRKKTLSVAMKRALDKINLSVRVRNLKAEDARRRKRKERITRLKTKMVKRERLQRLRELKEIASDMETIHTRRINREADLRERESKMEAEKIKMEAEAASRESAAAEKISHARLRAAEALEKEQNLEEASARSATFVTRKKNHGKTSVTKDIHWVYNNFMKIIVSDERGLRVLDEEFLAREAPSEGAVVLANVALDIGHVLFCREYVSKVLQKEKAPVSAPAQPKEEEKKSAGAHPPDTEDEEEVVEDLDTDLDDILGYLE